MLIHGMLLTCTIVELEGVEPSSKQGNHTLSTCLFRTSVFVQQQDPDHPLLPYPLNASSARQGFRQTIPDFTAPLDQRASEQQLLSDVSSLHLVER